MAKESLKAKEVKRARLVAKYAAKRTELKKIINSNDNDYEAKQAAIIALQKLPPNSNPIRMHNRCKLTGRPKGYIRQFGISRINFREMALAGLIPGVKKTSW
ncbi:MAG TPA: 30S ribosomal protein S14 [Bacteroidales bacterium]|jgi:small subunit ribosomal protein S14|nr:30S ribosomal protein S14 [Bacteroidales bacterium]HOF46444.1 30S ribosomal protein S14 [Bacteroidales bacterium]HOS57926.1 30S ribosomal protein S14 [Bacteroidales bacterium]HPY80793.1 30S ribosomal protein S14 [Bacteroidales bacterium]HQA86533.1 30S ribosomal protein S14 [Bacteroidales bacterium]